MAPWNQNTMGTPVNQQITTESLNRNAAAARSRRSLGLAYVSWAFGFFGMALCWFFPMDVALSVAGIVTGLVGVILSASTGRPGLRLSLGGVLFSLLALAIDIVVVTAWLDEWMHTPPFWH